MADIMVIDDDTQALALIRNMLETAGHSVTAVSSGGIALKTFNSFQTDIVVTDIVMPDIDGLEVIVQIKKNNPSTKVIAVSGGGRVVRADFLSMAKSVGADVILRKPFTQEDLLTAVDTITH